VIVPHLYGKAAPIEEIEEMLRGTGVALIDDAAQSLGAKRAGRMVGTFGDFGIVACGPGKSLAGPAGAFLVSNRPDLITRAQSIRLANEPLALVLRRFMSFCFWRRFRRWTLPFRIVLDRLMGPESEPLHSPARLSNLDAAIILCQLTDLDANAQMRRKNRAHLKGVFEELGFVTVSNGSPNDVALKLIVLLPPTGFNLSEVVQRLARVGVECQGGYAALDSSHGALDESGPPHKSMDGRVLCIPIESPSDPERIREALRESYGIASPSFSRDQSLAHLTSQHQGWK
jgi:dTDP-4-amino-4,6-dideoxygalactose transaminase